MGTTIPDFREGMTIREAYGPAMSIEDQETADAYVEAYVEHARGNEGLSRAAALDQMRQNLGYFAGYCDDATRVRVERLFACEHPIFGKAKDGAPTTEEAFLAGIAAGKKAQP